MALSWEQAFAVLRERSTLAGLTGLGIAIASSFGHSIDERVMTEIVLAIISIVAIATKPEGHHRGDHTRHPGSDLRGAMDDDQVPGQKVGSAEKGTGAGGGGNGGASV